MPGAYAVSTKSPASRSQGPLLALAVGLGVGVGMGGLCLCVCSKFPGQLADAMGPLTMLGVARSREVRTQQVLDKRWALLV